MKEVKVNIGATTVKSVKYDNTFLGKPGEPTKLAVKTNFAVKLNPAQPTTALVIVKFVAEDEGSKSMSFELETVTSISVSTFVDNLDDLVKNNYMSSVMLAVNEKIKTLTSTLGLNLQTPAISFNHVISD